MRKLSLLFMPRSPFSHVVRALQLPAHPKTALTLLLALSTLTLAICGALTHHFWKEHQTLKSALASEHAALDRLHASAQPKRDDGDVSSRLPARVDPSKVLNALERACTTEGITLSRVQVTEQAATKEQLGRADFNLSMAGAYPKVKQVVSDLLSGTPNLTVAQWQIRRADASGLTEHALVLSLWSAPGFVRDDGVSGSLPAPQK